MLSSSLCCTLACTSRKKEEPARPAYTPPATRHLSGRVIRTTGPAVRGEQQQQRGGGGRTPHGGSTTPVAVRTLAHPQKVGQTHPDGCDRPTYAQKNITGCSSACHCSRSAAAGRTGWTRWVDMGRRTVFPVSGSVGWATRPKTALSSRFSAALLSPAGWLRYAGQSGMDAPAGERYQAAPEGAAAVRSEGGRGGPLSLWHATKKRT